MDNVHSFRFTPKDGAARLQQVHEATFTLVHDDKGRQRLSIWVKTTRPGETTDDRGVEDWDSPAIVCLLTDPLELPAGSGNSVELPNAIATEKWGERFLYYWDHSDFVTARMTVRNANDRYEISFDGHCEAGNRVTFEAAIPAGSAGGT